MKASKPDWDEYFLGIAEAVSKRATCPRKHVGAVIVRDEDRRIVSAGYNGAEAGLPECIDEGCTIVDGHCVRTIHAEQNAIDYGIINKTLRYTLYVTLEPCDKCYMEIAKFPIYNIVWRESQEEYQKQRTVVNG